MATQTNSRIGDVSNLLQLLGLSKPGSQVTTTSGGGSTTQKMLGEQDVLKLITSVLGQNQGLAAVSSGQRSAGLYNSTVNTQLVNDLLARVSTQVAAEAAPTVTTRQDSTQKVQQKQPQPNLLGIAGSFLGNKLLQKTGVTKAVDEGFDKVLGSIFGTGAGSTGVVSAIPSGALEAASSTADPIGSLYSLTSGFSSLGDLATSGSNAASTFSGSALDIAGLGGDAFSTFAPENWISDAGGYAGDMFSAGDASSSIPYLGAAMSLANGNSRAAIGSVAGSYFGPVGSFIGGKVAAPVMQASEDFWMNQGGSRLLNKMDPIAGITKKDVDVGEWFEDQVTGPTGGLVEMAGGFASDAFQTMAPADWLSGADVATGVTTPWLTIGNIGSNLLEEVFGNNVVSNAWQDVIQEPISGIVDGVGDLFEDLFGGWF